MQSFCCRLFLSLGLMSFASCAGNGSPANPSRPPPSDLLANRSYSDDYPYQNLDFNLPDVWQFFYRECTSFAAWRMNRDGGTRTEPYWFINRMNGGHWGDAENWDANATSLKFLVDQSPEVGAVAQWHASDLNSRLPGHVAYVERVNSDGTVDVTEYNYQSSPRDHTFGYRLNIRAPRYIHIQRPRTTPSPVPTCRIEDIADTSRWSVEEGSGIVNISGQHVELRAVAGQSHTGLVSRCGLQGNFDVQVEYALINWPAGNLYGLRLGTDGGQFGIYRTGAGFYSVFASPTLIAQMSTNDRSGRLRLVRADAVIAGYYAVGRDWVRLGGTSVGEGPTRFVLDLSAQVPSTPSELVITFDNFQINFGSVAN